MNAAVHRRIAAVAVAVLLTASAGSLGGRAPNASAQELPPLPPLPEDVESILEGLSPGIWTACDAAGLTVTLLLILGVPTEVTTPLGPAFGLCSLVPVPQPAPDCAVDESLPPLGALGRPVAPGAVLVSQADALDALLTRMLGLDGILGAPLAAGLECTPATTDTTPPPPEGTLAPVAPPATSGGAPPPEAPATSPAAPAAPPASQPSAEVAAPLPGGGLDTSTGAPGVIASSPVSTEGWTAWRILLAALGLSLGAYGLPRVSFPNGRFGMRQ